MEYNKLTDQELVSRFVKGDLRSIESLITRHRNKVYTYLMISVKNPHIADDLFQDTFIKVINSLKAGSYKDEGRFLSWVIRIAHNLCIDHFRREKNKNTWSNDANEIDVLNSKKFSDINIEDLLVQEQISKDVRNLIDELPDDQKQVVLLRHYGELSFKEIAEQTGVSINTALGRMRYALINMRKIIEEKNINLSVR